MTRYLDQSTLDRHSGRCIWNSMGRAATAPTLRLLSQLRPLSEALSILFLVAQVENVAAYGMDELGLLQFVVQEGRSIGSTSLMTSICNVARNDVLRRSIYV